jgi:hypothetical protein
MNQIWITDIPQIRLQYYYLIVLILFLFLIITYRKHGFSVFLILIFFGGLFSALGKNIQNIYSIVLVALTVYFIFRTHALKYLNKKSFFVFSSFIIFSITFLTTAYINDDYFLITFSQYSRYFIVFSVFNIFKNFNNNQYWKSLLLKTISDLIFVQIALAFLKFFIIGRAESVVGSIASQGGALATSLPMLGFVFLWVKKDGHLLRKDWLYTIGLFFIGFVSFKRAIWFAMPVLIAFMVFYVPNRKVSAKLALVTMILIPIIFYLGVRFDPTLNKEGKIGGNFDVNFVMDYTKSYMFGNTEENIKGIGRGGATLLIFDKFISNQIDIKEWFGYGLRFMYATDYEEFAGLDFGINHKGSATGVFQTMVSNGYIGIVVTLLFFISILLQIKNRRLRFVMMGFLFWEYFFYTGSVFRELPLSILLIYLVAFNDNKIVNKRNIAYSKRTNEAKIINSQYLSIRLSH